MSLQCVKDEVEWEAEYVEELWRTLYATHDLEPALALGPEATGVQDIALQAARGCVAVAGDLQSRTEAAQDSEDVLSTQCRESSVRNTIKTEATLDRMEVSGTQSNPANLNTDKTPKTEVVQNPNIFSMRLVSSSAGKAAREAVCVIRDSPSTIPNVEHLGDTQTPKTEPVEDLRDVSSTPTSLENLNATQTPKTEPAESLRDVSSPENLGKKLVDSTASNTAKTQATQDQKNYSGINFSVKDPSASKTSNRATYDPGEASISCKDSNANMTAEIEAASTRLEDGSTIERPSLFKKKRPILTKPCSVKLERKALKSGFVCQICQKISNYKHNLMNHILSHTQAEIATIKFEKKIIKKPNLNCHICGKGLANRNSLLGHLRLQKCDPVREQMLRRKTEDILTRTYYTCDLCGMSTLRKTSLMKHMKRHAKEEPFVCQVCKQQFKAAWEMFDHIKLAACKPSEESQSKPKPRSVENMLKDIALKPCYVNLERIKKENAGNTVIINEATSFTGSEEELFDEDDAFETEEETYYCGVCEVQFETLSSLGDHVCDPKKLSCNVCKKRFKHQCTLDEHLRIHTGEKPFTCNECQKLFRLKHSLRLHIQTMHGSQIGQYLGYSCKLCKEKFRSGFSLKKHVLTHTRETVKKPYSCKTCKKEFRYKGECVAHERVHTGEKPFKCTECHNEYRVVSDLRIHSRTHSGVQPYTCEYCNRSFRTWQLWDHHKRVHTNERPFKCDTCNKQFKRPDTLIVHRRTHTGERPYVCKFCSKRFKQRSHLKSHQKTHTGEKPFGCDICNKRFSEPNKLRNHSRVHSEERPHSCDVCQKSYKDSQTLKTHKRTHTGEKPYQCKICKKQCSQSSNLRTHMKTHGKKTWPYSCYVCEKRFQTRLYLNRHLSLHDGQTHMCDVCGAKFRSRQVLSAHARTHYGGE